LVVALRVVLGFGVGLISVVCPLYVSEMSPTNKKGFLGALFQIAITVGIVIAFLVGLLVINATSNKGEHVSLNVEEFQWRFMMGTGVVPAILLLFLALFIVPESYVVSEIYHSINNASKNNCFQLFHRRNIRSTVLGIMLAATLQLTGINVIMYYGVDILKNSLKIEDDPILALGLNLIVGIWNSVTTLIALFLVDRWGRRPLMLFGVITMTIALVFTSLTLQINPNDQFLLTVMMMIGLGLFLLGFEAGPGCLFWILMTEINQDETREIAASFINFLQWGFNLLITSVYPLLVQHIGLASTFWIYAGIGVLVSLYLIFELKETKQ